MGRPKKLTAADMMEISAKRMLRGAIGRLGSPERLGELLADIGDNLDPSGMPKETSDSIRVQALKELSRLVGQFGAEGDAGMGDDQEALDAYIRMHEAQRPAEETEAPDDDDSE